MDTELTPAPRWINDWRGENGIWFIRNQPDDPAWVHSVHKRNDYVTLAYPSLRAALEVMFAQEADFAPCVRDARRCYEEKVMIDCGYVETDEGKDYYWTAALLHKDHVRTPFLHNTVVKQHLYWRPLAFGTEFRVVDAYQMLSILSDPCAGNYPSEVSAIEHHPRVVPFKPLYELCDKARPCISADEDYRDTFRPRCFTFYNPFTGKTMTQCGSLFEVSHAMGCWVDLNWDGFDDVYLHETCRYNGFDFVSSESWIGAQFKEFQCGFAGEYCIDKTRLSDTPADRIFRGLHTPLVEQRHLLRRNPGDPTPEEIRKQNAPAAVVKRQTVELAQKGKEILNKLSDSI